jgi:hypothetical protein
MSVEIISYTHLKKDRILLNDKIVFPEISVLQEDEVRVALYKALGMNYPKFYKMDRLCKIGLLATELVLSEIPALSDAEKTTTALIFANRTSSLPSDRHHVTTIRDKEHFFPSPAVFVYTLPNIVIGEIAIRHQLKGENAFFVTNEFDAGLFESYTFDLMNENRTPVAFCGWINDDTDGWEAFVYCVKKSNFKGTNGFARAHTNQNIKDLFIK